MVDVDLLVDGRAVPAADGRTCTRTDPFTGEPASRAAAASVEDAVAAAEVLKPVLLELGGKAPSVVLEDADLEAAVNATIFGAFMNRGQICMSTERVVVHEAVADELVRRLAGRASALPAGDPRGPVVPGSLVDEAAARRMDEPIADAVAKGGEVVAGGTREGGVVAATFVDRVDASMRLHREESFGPVRAIVRVADEAEAIRVASDSEYGLSAAVYGRDVSRALRVADRLETGICHVNGPTLADEPQMPFGGVKASGHGRFGGKASIEEFTVLRRVTIEDPGQHYPFREGARLARMNTVATVTRARVRDGFELAATRRTLPIALLRAREAVMDRFRPVLSRHDVSEQQWRVLRVLQETGTTDAATLAALACVLPPSLTRMLKALEARGLIGVARHPEDGRRAQIDLTRRGEELIREIAPQSVRIYDDIEARVGHDRIERLLDELEWVLGALDANAGDGGAKRRA